MQVCTSLQTDNHASTPPLSFFTGRMPFLPPNQQRQSTEGTVLKKLKLILKDKSLEFLRLNLRTHAFLKPVRNPTRIYHVSDFLMAQYYRN